MIPPKTATFHDLKGKSVFITGGGSGIGAALSEGFLAQGASVAFVQRSDATAFCEEMVEKYDQIPLFIPCDITDIGALERAIDEAAEVHGAIQVLVNNAANDERHVVGEVREDFWDWSQAINLKAYIFYLSGGGQGNSRHRRDNRQFFLYQLHDGQCGLCILCGGKRGDHRSDLFVGP